jgi:iron complex transport system substrate-binding protein
MGDRLRIRTVVAALLAAVLMAGGCSADDTTQSGDVSTTSRPAITTTNTPQAPQGVFVGVDGVASDTTDTSRIVSLTGDITEIIFALGRGDDVVAVDITTTYPEAADQLKRDGANVGFGQALSAEAVLRYEPTLVIGDQTIEPAETIEQLRNAGVPVAILEYQTTLPGVETKIMHVAEILGEVEAGQELAGEVMESVAVAQRLAARAETAPRVAYLYSRGPSLLFLFGANLPTQAMIEGAGALDAGAELGEGPISLTPEALIAAAPDVIVLPESGVEGLGGLDALLEIPGVAETPAAAAGAFLVYDEAYFFNLGPRVGDALTEFVNDLYPELAD